MTSPSKNKDQSGGFLLSALIRNLANDLTAAQQPDASKAIIRLEKCELELAVSVKADAKGGLKFWLVEAGGSVSSEATSRVKLSFLPVDGKTSAFPVRTGDKKETNPDSYEKERPGT